MSRMQEASGALRYKCAQLATSITSEAYNEEISFHAPEPNCFERSDFGGGRRGSGTRSVQHPTSRGAVSRLLREQSKNDSLDAQIRLFKERQALRECRLPGMVGGVSRKACEGWQRQARAHSARLTAQIKLGPCKDCKYFSEPSGSPLRRKNRKSRFWMMS